MHVMRSMVFLFALAAPVLAKDADQAAIEAAAQKWVAAFNRADVDAMAALTSEEVVLMDASMPGISGIEAARSAWRRSIPDAGIQLTSVTKELELSADYAWRIVAFTQQRSDKAVVSRGQALEIWKRISGAWKLHRQMSSGILARQPILRRPLPSEPILDREKN